MIVELFGIPGAGKTYAINQIHPGAVKENKDKNMLDYAMEPFKRIIKFLIILFPYAFMVRKRIRTYIYNEEITEPKYKPVKISDFVKNISMLSMVYKYSRDDVFIDEGIVHRTITMCINYGLSKEVCYKIIKELGFVIDGVRVIYLDVPKQICLDSIIKRNRHDHAIDKLTGERLNEFLEYYDDYCSYIYTRFGFEKMTRSDIDAISVKESDKG